MHVWSYATTVLVLTQEKKNTASRGIHGDDDVEGFLAI